MTALAFDVLPIILGALMDEQRYWRETAALRIKERIAAVDTPQRSTKTTRRMMLDQEVRNLSAALEGDFHAGCIACGMPVYPGQVCLPEVDGAMHADCDRHRYAAGDRVTVDAECVEVEEGYDYPGYLVTFAETPIFTPERIIEIRDLGAQVAASKAVF